MNPCEECKHRSHRFSKEDKEKLLACRDALLTENIQEAYHQLYLIADPKCESLTPWKELEEE